MNLLIQSYFIVYLLPFVNYNINFFITCYISNSKSLLTFFNCNSKGCLIISDISSQLILGIFLTSFIIFVFEYSSKLERLYFMDSLSSKIISNKFSENNNIINKSNSNIPYDNIKQNSNCNEIEKSINL